MEQKDVRNTVIFSQVLNLEDYLEGEAENGFVWKPYSH